MNHTIICGDCQDEGKTGDTNGCGGKQVKNDSIFTVRGETEANFCKNGLP